MRKIYKYPIPITELPITVLELPYPAEILSAGVQNNSIVLWAAFDPDNTIIINTEVIVVPTGGEFDETKGYDFIQTIFIDWMVFHVFARKV